MKVRAVLVVAAVLTGMIVSLPGSGSAAAASPASATDATQVPHYFGPWPNWANSPFTLSNASVKITGDGTGAAATAQVDPATGGIASVEVTAPGKGYTTAPTVTVGGGDGTATATAAISTSGALTGFTVSAAGAGYSGFAVALSGGGGSGATATASGGVDAVAITDGGTGYTMPTVEFDLPSDPNGKQAKGHVPMVANGDPVDGMDPNGKITSVLVDDPGSGYTTTPGVAVHNGTLFDPIAGATEATVVSTLKLTAVSADAVGTGYSGTPGVTITDPTGTGTGAGASATTTVGSVTGIAVNTPGSGYLTVGMKKFQDELPLPCDPAGAGCPTDPAAKYLPLAVPEKKVYNGVEADEYVIGLVQYRTKFSSDLPDETAIDPRERGGDIPLRGCHEVKDGVDHRHHKGSGKSLSRHVSHDHDELLRVKAVHVVIVAAHAPNRKTVHGELCLLHARQCGREELLLDLRGHAQLALDLLFLQDFEIGEVHVNGQGGVVREGLEMLEVLIREVLSGGLLGNSDDAEVPLGHDQGHDDERADRRVSVFRESRYVDRVRFLK